MTRVYTKIEGYEVLEDKLGIVVRAVSIVPWLDAPTDEDLNKLMSDYESAKGFWIDADVGLTSKDGRLGVTEVFGGVSQKTGETLDKVLEEVTI